MFFHKGTGIVARVVNFEGKPTAAGETGYLVIERLARAQGKEE